MAEMRMRAKQLRANSPQASDRSGLVPRAPTNGQGGPGNRYGNRSGGRPVPPVEPGSSYLTFGELLALIWRQKIVVASCVAAGAIGGVVLALAQRPVYQAKTALEVRMPNEDYLNRRQLAATVEAGQVLIEPFLQTQMKLLQSETLLMQTAFQVNLANQPEYRQESKAIRSVFAKSSKPQASQGLSREALIDAIRQNLTVRLVGTTQVMEILYEAQDPSVAATFANALASEYRKQSLARHVRATHETEALLAKQVEESRMALEDSEATLREYVTVNALLPAEIGRDSVAEARLRQVQSSLTTAQEARVAEQAKFELSEAARTGNGDSLESDALRVYRVKLAELRQKMAEAESIYRPDHYRVRQIGAEIAEVQRALDQESRAIVQRNRSQLDASIIREKALEEDYKRQAAIVATQSAKTIRFGTLKADVEAHRLSYTNLLQKAKDAGVASALQTSNIQIIDPAMPPESPIRPNKSFYLALGLMGGSLFGLVGAFARDRFQGFSGGRVSSDVSFGPPRLASMPAFDVEAARVAASSFSDLLGGDNSSLKRILDGGSNTQPESSGMARGVLAPTESGQNLNSEQPAHPASAFRDLLGPVAQPLQTGAARVLMLSSARAGEGRTTVACNLATATAASGKSVLIIDANYLHPQLHEVFHVPNDFGFSDLVIRSAEDARADAMGAVWTTEIDRVCVLPCGSAASKIARFAGDGACEAVLEEFKSEFDLVLLDAPPVLSAADAASLGRRADGTVLIIRSGITPPDVVEEAVQQLGRSEVAVLGAIHNVSEA